VFPGSSSLVLPVRPDPGDAELAVPEQGEPEAARPITVTPLAPGRERWTVTRDLADNSSALDVVKDLGVVRIDDIDLELTRRADERYTWVGDDVGSVRGEVAHTMSFARDAWAVETRTRTVLTSTATDFRLHAQLDAYEGDERVFAHSWRLSIPRNHV
jgi:uncharacterized protein